MHNVPNGQTHFKNLATHASTCSILEHIISINSYQATINWHVTIPMEKID